MGTCRLDRRGFVRCCTSHVDQLHVPTIRAGITAGRSFVACGSAIGHRDLMGLSSFVCEECGARRSGKPTETVTGRRVCGGCADDLLAAAAGVMANPERPMEGAIATRGWFRLLRRR